MATRDNGQGAVLTETEVAELLNEVQSQRSREPRDRFAPPPAFRVGSTCSPVTLDRDGNDVFTPDQLERYRRFIKTNR